MNTDPPLDLAGMRQSYELDALDEHHIAKDPLLQFKAWMDQAVAARVPEPSAMTLATVDPTGRPSTRVVLLKGLDVAGLIWFTNYQSRKGRDLLGHPMASLQFFWPELERVVRVEGSVAKVTDAESDAYFRTRPLSSRVGAWASPQSEVIESRLVLEQAWSDFGARLGDDPPRPPHWGGYRLVPDHWEFWQGRRSRLHDRLCFDRQPSGDWALSRLAP